MDAAAPKTGSNGLAVDAQGNPAIDPTANVLALVLAAVQRQDDLRAAQDALTEEKVTNAREVSDLRAKHGMEIRALDSDRLKSIREVDVLAGDTAARRADLAIQTLATTTSSNAETLRAMVASTAATLAGQLDQKLASVMAAISSLEKNMTDRIAALEKSSYTGAGKEGQTDPMLANLVSKMESLLVTRAGNTGKGEGATIMWGIIAAVFGLIIGLGGMIAAILK